jgi:transcription termination factor Rho
VRYTERITVEQNSNDNIEQHQTPDNTHSAATEPTSASVSQEQAEESSVEHKPASRRAPRRATTTTEEAAEAQEAARASASAEPKKRAPARSRKKTAEADDASAEQSADSQANQTSAESSEQEVATADAEPAKKAPAKRASRAKTKAGEASAEASASETDEKPATRKRASRAKSTKAADTDAAQSAGSAEQVEATAVGSETEAVADAAAAEQPTQTPKRQTRGRRSKAAEAQGAAASEEPAVAEQAENQSQDEQPQADEPQKKQDRSARGKKAAAKKASDKKSQAENAQRADDTAEKKATDDKDARAHDGDAQGSRGAKNSGKSHDEKSADADKSADANAGASADDQSNNRKDKSNSRSRTRQRDRKRRGQNDDGDVELTEDDVLLPIAGILDVLDNYAFVRTTGYLPGVSDVYVSLSQVKRYQLRKGDAIVGAIRQPRDGQNNGRQKYNAIVKIDSINGQAPEDSLKREQFDDLTPVQPNQSVSLSQHNPTTMTRGIDLFAPVALGQRGLFVHPSKANPADVFNQMAKGFGQALPDAHMIMLLVGGRPEDVTDMRRSFDGEVVAASCDSAPEDQVTVVELTLERAKRLVELGHDVVLFLDSLTAAGEALNMMAPPQHRNQTLGADDSAITQTIKRLFGAARNVENGGSLAIFASVAEMSLHTEALLDIANWAVTSAYTSQTARAQGGFDYADSAARNSEQLLKPATYAGISKLREAIQKAEEFDGEGAGGWLNDNTTAVLDLLRDTTDNDQFLVKLAAKLQ